MFLLAIIVKIFGNLSSYNMMTFIPLFSEVLICLAAVQTSLKKRKYYWPITIGWLLAYIGLFFLVVHIKDMWPSSLFVRILCTLSLYSAGLGYCHAAFDENNIDILLAWTTVVLIREAVDVLCSFTMLVFGTDPRTSIIFIKGIPEDYSMLVNGFVNDAIHALYIIGIRLLFVKNDHQERDVEHIRLVIRMSVGVSLLTVVVKNFLVHFYNADAKTLYYTSNATILFTSVILLFFRNALLKSNNERNERRTIHMMLKNEKAQYETLSENLKTINMMTHDLKHQIENFQDRITKEEVESLKDAIQGYDSVLKTGNDVIDTVIYEKEMYCKTKGIVLTCNANGASAAFMQNYHLYSLLNNALGNAIEAVEQLDNSEKKKVGLSIYPDEEYLNIECYNYFDPLKSDTEKTTKINKNSHGYGIKSINYIAERYKGNVSIRKDGDMFFLEVRVKLNCAPSTYNV